MMLIPWRKKKTDSTLAVPSDPWQQFKSIDRLFNSFFEAWPLASPDWSSEFVPRMSVSEDDQQILVRAELPGMDQENVQVTLSDGQLTISGEKREERDSKKDEHYHLAERSYGKFSRSFEVGAVEVSKVKAAFTNGMLSVTLPKREEAKPKKINVEIE